MTGKSVFWWTTPDGKLRFLFSKVAVFHDCTLSVKDLLRPFLRLLLYNKCMKSSVVDAIITSASKIESPRAAAAYLLFMCLRHTDNTNDDNLLKVTVGFGRQVLNGI